MRTALVLTALLTLGACATGPAGPHSYQAELDRLEATCQARGGILTPTGDQSGRPQTDYACKITGGASRLTGG